MSRLIVKNLPKSITEEKIRSLFSQNGTITDVQLKFTPDGKFRQFAFVGFQKEAEAAEAIKSLDKTFINTSKISVEACAALGDSKKAKSWSKYAPDSTAFKEAHPELKIETENLKEKKKKKKKEKQIEEEVELLTKYKDDPLFEEFLQVHAPEESKKLQNITRADSGAKQGEDSAIESDDGQESKQSEEGEEEEKVGNKIADKGISDMEYMKELMKNKKKESSEARIKKKKEPKNIQLFTVKLKGLPYNCKKKDIKLFFKPVTPFTIRQPVKIPGIAYAGFKTEKDYNKALLKDRSFISGKRILVAKYSSQSEITNSESPAKNVKNNKWKNQEESLKNEEDIAESGNIFVRNLSYMTVESDLDSLFAKFGPVAELNLPIDSTTKKPKGFATVTFLMPEHAVKAYSELDGSVLHGRMLHLLPGKTKNTDKSEEAEDNTNYKKQKAVKQKSQAGSSHNWNSLFLGHDAVAGVIAETYSTSKENVLLSQGDASAAVRLALGETQIVAQTKQYLEQRGVVLDAFSNMGAKRSKTLILVKNLPVKTEVREIRTLFEKYGGVGRVILPPSGITSLVEFGEPSEARKAFTCLAYTKFKNVPLYLEWAPENTLVDKEFVEGLKEVGEGERGDEGAEKVVEESQVEEEEEEPEPDTTLFVKNLNFQTTDESLKKHFAGCGKIFYANVATKKDKNHPGQTLSMGYGFVRFVHKSSTDKALKTLQQTVLDGKSLELKRSERTLNNDVQTAKKSSKATTQTGTKILVRNVPFQANQKEIRELFSTFGEIKALRLPKKMGADSNSHRGFAFVDYVTVSDAKNAFQALSQSTHLYGRRLVLEWASAEEGVDEIRKRTADHFKPQETVKSKKSVFNLD